MINQAVILAGGRGDRLRPLTDKIPKPMAPINGTPFLDYLIHSLVLVGIKNILILLGYKSEVIVSRYNNMKKIAIEFSYGSEEDQTGRRVINAYSQLDDYFLLLYGDNYWPIELEVMCATYKKLGANISTTVFSNKTGTGEYGFENNVVVGDDGMVVKYDKKRETRDANGVDIGYFLVSKDCLDPKIKGNVSFEEDILPSYISNDKLSAYITASQYYFITNHGTQLEFENATFLKNFVPLPRKYFGG